MHFLRLGFKNSQIGVFLKHHFLHSFEKPENRDEVRKLMDFRFPGIFGSKIGEKMAKNGPFFVFFCTFKFRLWGSKTVKLGPKGEKNAKN